MTLHFSPESELIDWMFGEATDSMAAIEARAREAFSGQEVVVWEGDPATFQFGYVGEAAEKILGYSTRRWIEEPTFWADVVVHPDDRHDAVAYCALATGRRQDHAFKYRAVAADGRVLWLYDIVKVIVPEQSRVPSKLRGVMLDVSERKQAAAGSGGAADTALRQPSLDALLAMRVEP